MRVLVAEDHVKLAEAVASGLRREGMAVDIALDGQQALDRAAAVDVTITTAHRTEGRAKISADGVGDRFAKSEATGAITDQRSENVTFT